jgi:Uma2 family endonuclease
MASQISFTAVRNERISASPTNNRKGRRVQEALAAERERFEPPLLRSLRLLAHQLLLVSVSPGSALGVRRLYREVVAVRLSSRNTFLPDLAYFSPEQVPLLGETFIPVAPAWVCEVLSPSTAEKDTGSKFVAYEEHDVLEYWILDPETRVHRFFYREGSFFVEFAAGESRIRSRAVAGFWVDSPWLLSESSPPVLECLRQVLGTP